MGAGERTCQGLTDDEIDEAAAVMMAADEAPTQEDNPRTKTEFKEWKAQFKTNLIVAHELYKDRQGNQGKS